METNHYYLKTNTENSNKMIANLRNLLFSNEEASTKLALQLLESGGVPDDLMTLVLGFYKWHNNPTFRWGFGELFKKFASDGLKDFIKDNWERHIEFTDDETQLSKGFQLIGKYSKVNTNDLANICLTLTQKGGKYCLENKTEDYQNILSKIIRNDNLILSNYQLNFLPEEVGKLSNVNLLNISGNKFNTLPESVKNLKKVKYLYYDNTPLSREYLSDFFPQVFYAEYYNEGCNLKANEKYLEAEKLFKRATELNPDYAEAWHNIGASLIFADKSEAAKVPLYEAIKKYEIRLQNNPKSAWNWFWKSCVYALLGNKEQSLEDLKTCIKIAPHYKEKASTEEDYRDLFEDEDFQNIIK